MVKAKGPGVQSHPQIQQVQHQSGRQTLGRVEEEEEEGGGRKEEVLTFSRDIILVFPKNMLGEAGDKGHRCSIWDLLTTAGDPPVSLRLPYPPPVPILPTL